MLEIGLNAINNADTHTREFVIGKREMLNLGSGRSALLNLFRVL